MNAPGGTRIRAGLEWVQSIDASPDYTLKRLSRGFGKLKVLAGGTAIVRAKIS
jgi:hypothetical protein